MATLGEPRQQHRTKQATCIMRFMLTMMLMQLDAAAAKCPHNNGRQFECFTVGNASETILSASAQFNANPHRVCDYNSHLLASIGLLATCPNDAPLPLGLELRIPRGTCVKMPGFACYEVQHGDTLESVTFGDESVFRDIDLVLKHNVHVLWGQTDLFAGMQLRMPAPACFPDHSTPDQPLICHSIFPDQTGPDTLRSVALRYNTTEETLVKLNQQRLGPRTDVAPGMQLSVPHPDPFPDLNRPCVPDPYGFWTCFTVPEYPVVEGDYLFKIAPGLNADPYKICSMNKLPNCSLIHPGDILHVPQTECTETDSYSCYTMPWNPTEKNSSVLCHGDTFCEPLVLSDTAVARGDTVYGAERYEEEFLNNSANNKFVTAFFGLNAAFRAPSDPIRTGGFLRPWYSNMHVKIPKLSACTTADPNACFTVTAKIAKQAADWAACTKNHYQNCTWPDSDYAMWLRQFTYCGDNLVFELEPANGMVFNYEVGLCEMASPLLPGMQLRLPMPKLVPLLDGGGGGGPSSKEECIDQPGPGGHWCYRMQQWVHSGPPNWDGHWSGDYLYNVSQNVPSLPMAGPDPWKPWCSFSNCSLVLPLAAVPIPIAGVAPTPSPAGNECHPSQTCNVCTACCQEYIPDGPACDNCVDTQCPHNECSPSKTCNVCAACCQPYIPDGSACDSCVTSECN